MILSPKFWMECRIFENFRYLCSQFLKAKIMKGFNKDTYLMVHFIYEDYSDYAEMFEIDWKPKDAIEYMMDSEFHASKELSLTEIIVSRVTKYEHK